MSVTILRGFKVSTVVFDAFLLANDRHETAGWPPFYKDHPDTDPISRLLYTKVSAVDPGADKNRFRILVPSSPGDQFETSSTVYVAYVWVAMELHRELKMEEDLPAEIPKGFEELRREILEFMDKVNEGEVSEMPWLRKQDRMPECEEGMMGVWVVNTQGIRGLMMGLESRRLEL